MSNHLAIATITATLQRILQHSIQMDVDGASVTTTKPENVGGGTPETGINIYLYHIKRNSTRGNADMPGRQRRGEGVKRNQIGIDLFYVLTFYGNDNELEPQRLLGSALRTLEDRGVLSPQIIRETIADPAYPHLAESDLGDRLDQIRAEFLSISTDELSKIWSVFFQTSYALSVVYKVTTVLIEGEEPLQRALPVRKKNFSLFPTYLAQQPTIQQVISHSGRYKPILTSSTLLIRGKTLAAPGTQVRINGHLINPSQIKPSEIRVNLSSIPQNLLQAGVQPLQISNQSNSSNGVTTLLESNVFPFVLRPTIEEINIAQLQELDNEKYSGAIDITLDLIVAPKQRVVLLLNHQTLDQSHSYLFEAGKRVTDSSTVRFLVRNIQPGNYLVRVQIDGAESILQSDRNPASETFEQYIAPMITIE